MSIFNQLRDNKGATKKRKLLCRGIGSGKGKTGGRGGKGQTARSGVALNGFEGGQMPLYQRLPKRGFNNFTRQEYEVINLDRLCELVIAGKLSKQITLCELRHRGLYLGRNPLKLLGNDKGIGPALKGIEIRVHKASKAAEKAAQDAGMIINYEHYTRADSGAKKHSCDAEKAEGQQ